MPPRRLSALLSRLGRIRRIGRALSRTEKTPPTGDMAGKTPRKTTTVRSNSRVPQKRENTRRGTKTVLAHHSPKGDGGYPKNARTPAEGQEPCLPTIARRATVGTPRRENTRRGTVTGLTPRTRYNPCKGKEKQKQISPPLKREAGRSNTKPENYFPKYPSSTPIVLVFLMDSTSALASSGRSCFSICSFISASDLLLRSSTLIR